MGRRSLVSLLALAAATLLMGACIGVDDDSDGDTVVGSGTLVTKTYDFNEFENLAISHAFVVDIVQADAFSVEITVDDNLRDHLQVDSRDGTLFIGLVSGLSTRNTTQEATVAMPQLRSVVGSGASSITLQGFDSIQSVAVNLSGASRISAELGINEFALELSGASTATLTGSATSATLVVSGASTVALGEFEIQTATVELSGASTGTIWVSDEISEVRLSGASTLSYRGQPVLGRVDVTGTSHMSPD